jgi:hypothetical protein
LGLVEFLELCLHRSSSVGSIFTVWENPLESC